MVHGGERPVRAARVGFREAVGPDDLGRVPFALRSRRGADVVERSGVHPVILRPVAPADQGGGGRVGAFAGNPMSSGGPPATGREPIRSAALMTALRPQRHRMPLQSVLVVLLLVAGSACGVDFLRVETVNPPPTTTTSTSTTTTTRPKPTTTTTRAATSTTVTTK